MISITCTNCQTRLSIDDAFAGGVCRCQNCGTIMTVPAHLKKGARPSTPAQALTGSKTLYQHRPGTETGTGLDELAGAVASSGLSSSRLRSGTATKSPPKKSIVPQKKQSPLVLVIASGVVILLVLIGIVIYVLTRDHSNPSTVQNPTVVPVPTAPTDGTGPVQATGPSFCGVPIPDDSVVYVLDRGTATEQLFDPLKAAVYSSIDLIGATRQFAVILTSNGTPDFAYPPTGLANATPEEVQKFHKLMDDTVATGSSKLRSAIEKAVALKPGVIIVVTAKWALDPDDAAALLQNSQRDIRFNTFILGDSKATDALEQAASRSGGTFRRVSESDLRKFGG